MNFNLLTSPWLPVRRLDGSRDHIRPAQIVDQFETNPVIMPDWPRPDLNIATLEMFIGLLTLASAPESDEDWINKCITPPTVAQLDAVLAPYAHAFNLDGDGSRFMQDFADIGEANFPIEALFIDSVGESARKKNSDLMVKSDHYTVLSRSSAAIALYALQQFAPAGGAGYRTSMRGGGPLTTLILPKSIEGESCPLWYLLWANTSGNAQSVSPLTDRATIFPWLAHTITSEKDQELHISDPRAHPLQAFFGMPRRIRLNIQKNTDQLSCDLTGEIDEYIITDYASQNYGVNYGTWRHPLTPYVRLKDQTENSRKAKAIAFNYQNWAAIALDKAESSNAENANLVAECVSHFNLVGPKTLFYSLPGGKKYKAKLLAAGWDMSNMTPLEYILSEFPLHIHTDPRSQEKIDRLAHDLVTASDSVARMLTGEIQNAMKSGKDKPGSETTYMENVKASFYQITNDPFHQHLDKALEADLTKLEWRTLICKSWLNDLQHSALTLFDEFINQDFTDPEKARPIIEARSNLKKKLFGKPLSSNLRLSEPPSKAKKSEGTTA